MKILLLGSNGQLGWALARALEPLGEVIALTSRDCDLADQKALLQHLNNLQPHVIVNAAAYTAVDLAESHESAVFAVNAQAPTLMAQWAQRHRALLVHYSSDYVFDGEKAGAYLETDAPRPLNVYGRSKWAADQFIMAECERFLILRTSWLHGLQGENFVKTILRLAAERDHLQVVNDQWGAPTSVPELAALTAHMVRSVQLDNAAQSGLYHATASGLTSWYGLAAYVVERSSAMGYSTRLASAAIEPCSSVVMPRPALRPRNSALDSSQLKLRWGWQMRSWRDGVDEMLTQLLKKTTPRDTP